MVEDIVAVDDYTVCFDLSTPNAFLLDTLCVYHAKVIPAGIDPESLTNDAIGTGPFILEEYVEGEHAIMKKNPDYWEEGLSLP
jgi:peptide/nickel transport system substrate-binding protein